MQMSPQGTDALVDEEGEVLRAYRDVAGVWTIGTGLTAGSGVVKPKGGMTITREESRRLLRLALARNYEPRVERALGPVRQHVFDGSVMFDFNTGAIHKASWVGKYLAGAMAAAGLLFKSWNKAGGKVWAGLVARRGREWDLIEFGRYPDRALQPAISNRLDFKDDLVALGYRSGWPSDTPVRDFQRDHGLNVDGKIGDATRSTIAREKAARQADKATGAAGAGGAAAGGGTEISTTPNGVESIDLTTLAWVAGGAVVLAGLVYLGFLAWRYRGPLLSWLPEPVKDWFEARGIVLGRPVRS